MNVGTCLGCGKSFSYRWSGRGNSCSKECTSIIIRKQKRKYTDEQIQSVADLKRRGIHNRDIAASTGVNLNKVKEIVKKHGLFLTPEQRRRHAYDAKVSKDPNAMRKMREAHMDFTQEEFERRILLVLEDVKAGLGNVTGLSPRYHLNPNSVVQVFHDRGWERYLHAKRSTAENEVREWVESLGCRVVQGSRSVIPPYEIDVYVPDRRFGIEYCGLYWHSHKDPAYHKLKLDLASKAGVRLITVFEDEWRDRRSQVQNFVKATLGYSTVVLRGSRCTVEEIDKEKARTFLDEHHIQGAGHGSVHHFGLYHASKLIGVVTGARHHRTNAAGSLVLDRLCFADGYKVHGGSSKLFAALVLAARTAGYKQIVSWSDNRWSIGSVYRSLGFTLEQNLRPDYSYVLGTARLSKQSLKKTSQEKMSGKTERQLRQEQGYSRIWDCGKKRWSFRL